MSRFFFGPYYYEHDGEIERVYGESYHRSDGVIIINPWPEYQSDDDYDRNFVLGIDIFETEEEAVRDGWIRHKDAVKNAIYCYEQYFQKHMAQFWTQADKDKQKIEGYRL